MENNIFTDKKLYSYHFNKDYRDMRILDFNKIYDILKDKLIPIQKANINEKKINKYINLYKEENQDFITAGTILNDTI